ncbi:MAG: transposase [Thermoguttaceae bacterium]|nr:transposase [Thermoguttaceae bacterium]
MLDSQSVKTMEKGGRGYDAGKKVNGRKRHLVVDVLRLILVEVVHPVNMAGVVHPANIQDRDGAGLVLEPGQRRFPRLSKIWVDGVYAGQQDLGRQRLLVATGRMAEGGVWLGTGDSEPSGGGRWV